MQHFQFHTAPQFAGFFDSDLWCRLVLQVGAREPCVRHNVIALGALHRAFQQGDSRPPTDQEALVNLQAYASSHYTKAIALLNDHIATHSWAGLDVSLLCCILCIGVEWLRGSFASAQVHLENGILVLQQWLSGHDGPGRRQPGGAGISPSSPTGHFIRNKLVPLYTRLILQAKTFANIPLPLKESLLEDQQPHNNTKDDLKGLRDSFHALLVGEYLASFPEKSKTRRKDDPDGSPTPDRLAKWFQKYSAYVGSTNQAISCGVDNNKFSQHSVSRSENLPPDITLLSIYHGVARILLATRYATSEAVFDSYTPVFQEILHLATEYANLFTPPASFTLDIAVVPVLFFIGTKCRDYTVRHKALALLRASHRREGIWDSIATARLVEEVIRIEEGTNEKFREVQDHETALLLDVTQRTKQKHGWNMVLTAEPGEDPNPTDQGGDRSERSSNYINPDRRVSTVQCQVQFGSREISLQYMLQGQGVWREARNLHW